jgi:purine catabolism regulator
MRARVAITVRQLVDTPHLGTRFHCGRAGADQVINWAHSCELPEPWDWLEPFDMLMTVGFGLPRSPAHQARYVARLADAGISAIAIAEGVDAPRISASMVRASERRALPILLTAFEVPFAALARVVAEAKTDDEERLRLLKTARIYESLRAATIAGRDPSSLLEDLGAELGCTFELVELRTWRYPFTPVRTVPPSIRTVLGDALTRCAGHLPAILRLDIDGHAAVAVPVPSRRPAALLASRFTGSAPELSVLQHASTVAALQLEKLASERDALNRSGSELFAELLAGRQDAARATSSLRAAQLASGDLLIAAWSQGEQHGAGSHGAGPTALHQELFARAVPHLLRLRDSERIALALIPADRATLELFLDALPDPPRVGLSGTITSPDGIADAARQARWALHAGVAAPSGVVRYGESGEAAWTLTLEDSEELAEHVLGALLRYDQTHQTELVHTLAALLRNNRSPTRTAAELFIHRQTLTYRVRRIEKLTGRSLSSTKDVVELWLALRAVDVVEGSSLLGVGA